MASQPADLRILKTFLLEQPVFVRAMHSNLIAVQVRADYESEHIGHGVLMIIDWVKSETISPNSGDLVTDGTGVSMELRSSSSNSQVSISSLIWLTVTRIHLSITRIRASFVFAFSMTGYSYFANQ